MKERLDAAIDGALGARIVGCVILVSKGGELVYSRAAGYSDREAGRPMTVDTIFRLSSITKPIVATTALRMIDLGLLGLDDPVSRYLPFFTPKAPDGSAPDILIRHLLSHTSGLTYDNGPEISRGSDAGPMISLEENLRRLAALPLAFAPGTGWAYGMSTDVLGGVLAEINGSRLSEVVLRYVTGPLGMHDTRFTVTDLSRLAVPYGDAQPEPVRMSEPHVQRHPDGTSSEFSSQRILRPAAPQSGGSGMAGTAGDFLKLLEALRAGDILKPETRDAAFANQIGALPRRPQDAGKRFGFLGAIVADPAAAQSPVPAGTMDWGGVWGHNWILDPTSGISVASFSNTTFEGDNGPFREEIRDAIYG